MDSYNLADAKAQFSDLVARAEAGEEIEIKRRGEPVAKLVPVVRPRKKIDVEALRALSQGDEDAMRIRWIELRRAQCAGTIAIELLCGQLRHRRGRVGGARHGEAAGLDRRAR